MTNPLVRLGVTQLFKNFPEIICPFCGHKYPPPPIESFKGFTDSVICPTCLKGFPVSQISQVQLEARANLPGEFPRPPESRVQLAWINSTELGLLIPGNHGFNFFLFFGGAWIAFCSLIFLPFLFGDKFPAAGISALSLLFFSPGLAILAIGLFVTWGSTVVHLDQNQVHLKRRFGKFSRDKFIPTAGLDAVRRTTFYTKNYAPVFGIEISGPDGKLRFGSNLTDAEQNWICTEIRRFLKQVHPETN